MSAKQVLFFALLALGCFVVRADPPTEGDLEAVQAQTIMLKAQAAKAEAAKKLADLGGTSGVTTDGTPAVSEVYARQGKLYATFLYPDGTALPGKTGDSLPGGCRVLSVQLDAVRIRCRGKALTVGFSATAPTPQPRKVSQTPTFQPTFPPVPGSSN